MNRKAFNAYLAALFAAQADEPLDAGLWRTLARRVPA